MNNSSDIKTIYRHDLCSFIQFAFKTLYPHIEYLHNFHIDLIAHHLKLCENGKIKRLLINLPPRYLKSHMVSVAFPAWVLGRNPLKKIICAQGEHALASELEESTHRLMISNRYINIFPSINELSNGRSSLITPYGGYRLSVTTSQSLTGKSADIMIIDDPISTQQASDTEKRNQINRWYDENIQQRLNNKKDGVVIVVMQRLHPEDLSNYLLSKNEGWVHLNLPAIAMEDEIWSMSFGRFHKRLKGEALHTDRESKEELCNIMLSIGGWNFALQYLQGVYVPKFGQSGKGGLWLSPFREGEVYTPERSVNGTRKFGAYLLDERQLMLSKIFDIGEDFYPDNMRFKLTNEEFLLSLERQRKIYSNIKA